MADDFIVYCSWCEVEYSKKQHSGSDTTSHSICPAHKENVLKS